MRFLIFLVAIQPLFACYVGNPADPAIMNTGILTLRNPLIKATTGYQYDYTSNKRFIVSDGNSAVDPTLRKFALHTQSASVSLIFVERIEFIGSVGGTKQAPTAVDPASLLVDSHSSYQLSWGAGTKIILLQWGQTFFCTDFNYFAIPSSPKSFFKFLNRVNLPIDLEEQPFGFKEWQISAALASKFYFITPYVGTVYLRSHLHVNSGPLTGPIDYFNKKRWGFFFGVTLSITGRFHLNFERRVRDEFAYSFATTAVF